MIELYNNKTECCGCAACVNICPMNSIIMNTDENGFLYPEIDYSKCINCGKCKVVCAYKKEIENNSFESEIYAAAAKDVELIKTSASGGVFATLARAILKKGGKVYGCAMNLRDGKLYPEHIRVDNIIDLKKLQGSKYVQSTMGNVFKLVRNDLDNNEYILFSGTPCQIDALKSFLGNMDCSRLLTVDIICHGTPNVKFFQDYLKVYEKKLKGSIVEFAFRDKTNTWSCNGKVKVQKKDKKIIEKKVNYALSSYYRMFLKGEIYRENCYSCKYATSSRVGDITIGDYWGIEKMHPEYMEENGGKLDKMLGISCVLINTQKGKIALENIGNELIELLPSQFELVSKNNKQLYMPMPMPKERSEIFKLYQEGDYAAVEKWFIQRLGFKRYIYMVWSKIPVYVRDKILKICKV